MFVVEVTSGEISATILRQKKLNREEEAGRPEAGQKRPLSLNGIFLLRDLHIGGEFPEAELPPENKTPKLLRPGKTVQWQFGQICITAFKSSFRKTT